MSWLSNATNEKNTAAVAEGAGRWRAAWLHISAQQGAIYSWPAAAADAAVIRRQVGCRAPDQRIMSEATCFEQLQIT
jgi:hypothetical protein